MSHSQGVGPGRVREECALLPCESRPGPTQGSAVAVVRPLSAAPHPPLHALSWVRRVLSRQLSWV
jgi:hypothetical protein